MFSLVLFCSIGIGLYMFGSTYYQAKHLLKTTSIITIFLPICIYFIVTISSMDFHTSYYYLIAAPIFAIGYFVFEEASRTKGLGIVANQQRYWNEVDAKAVYDFFAARKDKKSDRIEIKVNREAKKFFREVDGERKINTNFFKTLKLIEPTLINSEEDLFQYPLYEAIYKKLSDVLKSKEIKLDINEVIKENANCAEFLLMDLWDKYTKDINIGIGSLIVLARGVTQEELVGALDNIDLNCIKPKGAALYYAYCVFKGKTNNPVRTIEPEIIEDEDDIEYL